MGALPDTGILGYGRFGRALGERLREAGAQVLALDPHSPPGPEVAADSVEALAEASELLVLAVPLVHMEGVLAELVPFLLPRHLVMDVGSVKTRPAAMLERVLGSDIPWVATHPLFGPVSLALGEPSRVVVCPNPTHPAAVARGTMWKVSVNTGTNRDRKDEKKLRARF
ncbi:MAG: prephenate dehydrogenase/arogenate dehydrogenase family protein [Planctomycetota bacterium]